MKKTLIYFILLFSVLFFNSCENLFYDEDHASKDPFANFNYLWQQCDTKYSYFDLKKIDWNKIKSKYYSKLYTGMSDDSLFNVLGSMLKELKDDHTNLISNFNISYFGTDHLGQDNFDWRIVLDHYLHNDVIITVPFEHNFIDNGNIGYIRFASYTGEVDEVNLDYIIKRYSNTKGLIIDIRENGGGAANDIFTILSRFVNTQTLLYYSRIKTGPGHNDFSEPQAVYIYPDKNIKFLKKVILLTDRGTFSAGSFTCLASKALPNLIMIGDTTGGGLGLPNGGQLPNGWTYRFSISQALDLDKKPDFENGVPPDIKVDFNWNDLTRDEILDRAIEELNK